MKHFLFYMKHSLLGRLFIYYRFVQNFIYNKLHESKN